MLTGFLKKKVSWATLFFSPHLCFSVLTLQSDLLNYREFMALSNPVFPYAHALTLKQMPLLYENGQPVLENTAFFDRLEREMVRARLPETAAERFFEAYVWRERAQSAYDELLRNDTELADFKADLQQTQADMGQLMLSDFDTLRQRLKNAEGENGLLMSDTMNDYSRFLSKQAADIQFEKIAASLNQLEKSLPKENGAVPDIGFAPDTNLDTMETRQGLAERDSLTAEKNLDAGTFDFDTFDMEKLDF